MNIIYNKGTNVYNFVKSAELQTESALKHGVITSPRNNNLPRTVSDAETAKIISEKESQLGKDYALTVLRAQSQTSAPIQKKENISQSFLEIFKSAFSELKRTLFDEDIPTSTAKKKSKSEIITTPEKGYFLTIPEKYMDELRIENNNPVHQYSNPAPKGILVNIIA
jgi:hypothetical protein